MPPPLSPDAIRPHDRRVNEPEGEIFLRLWRPADAQGRAPILLFHDSLGCIELWRGFPAALAEAAGRAVIAYDRLGFGRSSPRRELPGRDFVTEEARITLPLLQAELGFASFIACGHSVGGGMAAETAARHPQDCLALVTIGAQAFVERQTREGVARAKAAFQDPAALARLARYHGDKARWVVDAWTETWLSPAFADWRLDDAIARRRCPALALHGEEDEYGSAEHPRRIAGKAQGAARGEAVILPGLGHLPFREEPRALAALIADFLARRLPPRA